MATTDLYPLFSKPVVSIDHGGAKLQSVIDHCESKLEYISNAGNNFTSVNKAVFDLPEFSKIKKDCLDAVNNYALEILKWNMDDIELYVTQSWVNKNPPGTGHHQHYHLNCLLSGVYYLQTVPNDSIRFFNGERSTFKMYETERTIWNADMFDVPVKDNLILVFPSNMLHNVAVNESSYNRVSIAFNAFVKGKLGHEQTLNYLEL